MKFDLHEVERSNRYKKSIRLNESPGFPGYDVTSSTVISLKKTKIITMKRESICRKDASLCIYKLDLFKTLIHFND